MLRPYFIWTKVTTKQRNITFSLTLVLFIIALLYLFYVFPQAYVYNFIFTLMAAFVFFSLILFILSFQQNIRTGSLHWHQSKDLWFGILYAGGFLFLIAMFLLIHHSLPPAIGLVISVLFMVDVVLSSIFIAKSKEYQNQSSL